LIDYLIQKAIEEDDLPKKDIEKIIKDPKHLRKFRNSVEQSKKELTSGYQCQIDIQCSDLDISYTLNRATFEKECEPLF